MILRNANDMQLITMCAARVVCRNNVQLGDNRGSKEKVVAEKFSLENGIDWETKT